MRIPISIALLIALGAASCTAEEPELPDPFPDELGLGARYWATYEPFPFRFFDDDGITPGIRAEWGVYYFEERYLHFQISLVFGGDQGQSVVVNAAGESWLDFVAIEMKGAQGSPPKLASVPFEWIGLPRLNGEYDLQRARRVEHLEEGSQLTTRIGAIARIDLETLRRAWGELPAGDYEVSFRYDTRKARGLTPAFLYPSGWPRTITLRHASTADDRHNLLVRDARRNWESNRLDAAIVSYRAVLVERPQSLLVRTWLAQILRTKGNTLGDLPGPPDLDALHAAKAAYEDLDGRLARHFKGEDVDPDFYPPEQLQTWDDPLHSIGDLPYAAAKELERTIAELEEKEKKKEKE